ncbi:MAG: hypothetical protein LBP30_03970 [Clostridiales Family XIII bacterium]|nr:hypothetical protein [Clostridiales Family XIII bacterium]
MRQGIPQIAQGGDFGGKVLRSPIRKLEGREQGPYPGVETIQTLSRFRYFFTANETLLQTIQLGAQILPVLG